jgi:hypothetical protein
MHSFYYRVGPKFNYTDFADAVKPSLIPPQKYPGRNGFPVASFCR